MSSQIDEIKSRLDIAELVGSYIRLTKAGANFKALCPFHNERTPSFNVSPARQIWHCFGCGKGGDMFEFIQQIEGVEFGDALKTLADRAGVELKREDPRLKSERTRQFALLEEATKFFEGQLSLAPLEYLKKRGLQNETIKTFRLGYAPNEWRALDAHLKQKARLPDGQGFSEKELENSGLAVKSGQGFYDRFRGRIMFPIFDYSGRVVAFGGRIFPEKENESKYVNSPETALYQKSKILYGLNFAKSEILRASECVLVEGYMDAIMSWQGGVKNVVAASGTALAADQLKTIKRLAEKLIVAFDMDSAGEGASKRGIDLALAAGFDVRVAGALGEGLKDPADAVCKNPALWQKAVLTSRHIAQFYIDSALKKHKPDSPEAKREFQRTVLPVISSLADLERAHWVREVSRILNIKEEAVWSASDKHRPTKEVENIFENSASKPKARKELLEEKILGIAAEYPALAQKLDPAFKNLLAQSNKTAIFAELFLSGIIDAEAEFIKCQSELKKEYLREKLAYLGAQINSAEKAGEGNIADLMGEFQKISKELHTI
ncbi:MAG: DNA primase [Candidatus Giovannonibacteria bacterium]|nr:DNA primase [Candidatus Giovannonibacteria bacterium]